MRKSLSTFKLALFAVLLLSMGRVHAQAPLPSERSTSSPNADTPHAPSDQLDRQGDTRRPVIEVAFVLDTTGSMTDLIEGAKRKIWSIASRIAGAQPRPNLRVGLVGYRDKQDAYVTRHFQLNSDMDTVYEQLKTFQAAGGGDRPEHVGQALGEAVERMQWSPGQEVMRVIFIVGDAPPQQYDDGWDARTWAKEAARRGIIINTIRCGGLASAGVAFREIAALGQGSFATIDQTGGMVAIATPYDAEIEVLNRKLAGTLVYGGKTKERSKAKAKVRTLETLDADSAANRVQYLKKSGRRAEQGLALKTKGAAQPDVEDLVMVPHRLDSLNADELPMRLRSLSKGEQKRFLKKQARKRRALERKLSKLADKREAYIRREAPDKRDAFDSEVMAKLSTQAKRFGLTF